MRAILFLVCFCIAGLSVPTAIAAQAEKKTTLPKPKMESGVSIESALSKRRSVRSYSSQPLSLADVSQLLWSAQGITDARGHRTAPSAGATYPLKLYLVAGEVKGLDAGVYRYDPSAHELKLIKKGDKRALLSAAAFAQLSMWKAPVTIVIAARYERTTRRYEKRGIRYVHMEAGHVGENIYLQCVPLGLGTVSIGAFHDGATAEVLGLSEDEVPLYLMPVGKL